MPKVSVVIACYNQARYLPEAVGSLLAQTYRGFETVIVNDGSTDGTREVAEGLMAEHPGLGIRLINQENRGLSGARNAGIMASSGEYIQPLDADDMLAPEYIETVVKALDETPGAAFVYTAPHYFGELAGEYGVPAFSREYSLARLAETNFVSVCAMFRRGAWEDAGGFKRRGPRTGYYDWEFWLSLGEAGHYGKFIDRPLYMYRKYEGSEMARAALRHREITHWIRSLHLGLYYPVLCRLHPCLAGAANWLRFAVKDPVSHYLYRGHPALHAALRKLLHGAGRG